LYDTSAKDNLQNLWNKFALTRDINARNQLVMEYSYIVDCIVAKMRATCRNQADLEDMVSQGIISLMDAIERFDPAKGVKFESFASIKVRGAVIDYIRKQDWIPRRIRKNAKDLENAYSYLWSQNSREPTDAELANFLGITEKELQKNMAEVGNSNIVYLDALVMDQRQNFDEEYKIKTENIFEQPELFVQEEEFKNILARSIDKLSTNERTVISLYFYENLKLKEIAGILGVSESRVCQLNSSAVLKLKAMINKEYNIK